MTRYWVSWEQPGDDYRPVHCNYPPGMLGWWCSGYNSDNEGVLVALVEAEDGEAVKRILEEHWPELKDIDEYRFFEEVAPDYVPGNRFPLPDWSPLKKEK